MEYDREFTSSNRGTDRIKEQTEESRHIFRRECFLFLTRDPRISLQVCFFFSATMTLSESQNECQRAPPHCLQRTSVSFPAHKQPRLQFPASIAQCCKVTRPPGGGSAPAWSMLGVVDESDYCFLILGIPTWKMAVHCHGEFPSFVIGAKT